MKISKLHISKLHISKSLIMLSKNVIVFILLFACSAIQADPPGKVARISKISGTVNFLAAGLEDDWTSAMLNRPMTIGDRLWVNEDGGAELQLGTSKLCIANNTAISILNLDNKNTQFQLVKGRLNINIRTIAEDQNYEIDTPNLAFSITKPGTYRIEVDQDSQTTKVVIFTGQGDVFGETTAYKIDENLFYQFSGTELNYQLLDLQTDATDNACSENLIAEQKVQDQYQYVSQEVVGAEDLSAFGTWKEVESYGYAWIPNNIDSDWAPYQYGSWSWIDPWGWTWVDDAPWGFAPFHYGRWSYVDNYWAWFPGPISVEPIYAPALVVFLSIANQIGWFPLGYNEPFWPAYSYSPGYFININQSNTFLSSTQINNISIGGVQNVNFRNFRNFNTNAIRATSASGFATTRPARLNKQAINAATLNNAQVSTHAPITPTAESVMGGKKITQPVSKNIFDKRTITKTTPPPSKINFSQEQKLLTKTNGKPLNSEEKTKLQKETAPQKGNLIHSSAKTPVKITEPAVKRPSKQEQRISPSEKQAIKNIQEQQSISPSEKQTIKTISKPKAAQPPIEQLPKSKQIFQKQTPPVNTQGVTTQQQERQKKQEKQEKQEKQLQQPQQPQLPQQPTKQPGPQRVEGGQQRQPEKLQSQQPERIRQQERQQLQKQETERMQQERQQQTERMQQQQQQQQERIQQQQSERVRQQKQQQERQQQERQQQERKIQEQGRIQQQMQQQKQQQERMQQQQQQQAERLQQQRLQQEKMQQQQIQQRQQQERTQQQIQQQRQQQAERAQQQIQQQRQQQERIQQQEHIQQQMQQQKQQQERVQQQGLEQEKIQQKIKQN